jgi:uncharacterized protein (TIGR02217 family)
VFREQRFPTRFQYGSKGGPGFNTNVIVTDAGSEERVSRWETAKRQYDIQEAVKSFSDFQEIYAFFLNMRGCAYGFRFKDWTDYATTVNGTTHVPLNGPGTEPVVTHTDMPLGTGDGTTTRFRLRKVYTTGAFSTVRFISKPVSGTVKVGVGGVNQTSGFTVDTTTGEVIFTSAPANGAVLTAGCEFDVPVRFGKELDNPGHLAAGPDDFGYGSMDSIPLVELSDLEVGPGGASGDGLYCGAAVEVCLTENYQLSAGLARIYAIEANASGLSIFLPDEETTAAGGPVFWVINNGPNTVTLKTHGGSTLTTIAVGAYVTAVLAADGDRDNHWYLI